MHIIFNAYLMPLGKSLLSSSNLVRLTAERDTRRYSSIYEIRNINATFQPLRIEVNGIRVSVRLSAFWIWLQIPTSYTKIYTHTRMRRTAVKFAKS